jgi:hypothetical protein
MTTKTPLWAPMIAETGLPTAFIVKETTRNIFVVCPYCSGVHAHTAGTLGSRSAHCSSINPRAGHYEVRHF